ncbi:MAG: hypothetical protein ACPL68_07490, partial [Candidatus Hydrothermia bacterium]
MKRIFLLVPIVAGCVHEITGEVEVMGRPPRSIPQIMDGLSDGRAVVYFSDGVTHEVKLVDPRTGGSIDLNTGDKKNMVMALRTGWGDTIFVVTLEGGHGGNPAGSHLKLHVFAPDGTPRGKYVLKDSPLFVDFLVAKGGHPKGARIMTLNMAGYFSTVFDKTGKIIGSAGPYTGPEGPYLYAWMALADNYLAVIPRTIKSNCGNCPNYIDGPIRIYRWIGGSTAFIDSFPLIREIDITGLFPEADGIGALVARGYHDWVYIFVDFIDCYDIDGKPFVKMGHALVKVHPDKAEIRAIATQKYDYLRWGDDGRLYDA